MNGWYVWTHRDTGVAGWARDEAGSSPPDQSMDELLRTLSKRFPQLKPVDVGDTRSTQGIPIVTAAWVAKAERWVFVLRGVGGVFGAAGTTQVCAAPDGLPLAEAWPRFWAAVTSEERVDPTLLDSQERQLRPGEVSNESLRTTLQLLRTDGLVVEAPADPADTIRLYTELSRLVPESAARDWFWSTCHVASSIMNDERIVTGRWPALISEAWQREYRRLTVGDRYKTKNGLQPPTPEESATVAWLLGEAAHGRYPLKATTATTISDALDEASHMRPLTIEDAEIFARQGEATAAQLERLAETPGMIRQFSLQKPELALQLLDQVSQESPLHAMIVLGLILSDSPPEKLVRQIFSEALYGGGLLTRRIKQYFQVGDNQKVARRILDGYLHDEVTLLNARGWLKDLSLTTQDVPELFVFDPTEVASIANHEPARAASIILEQSDPWKRLNSVFSKMDPTNTQTMLLLVHATANDPKRIESVPLGRRLSETETIRMIESLNNALDKVSDDATHRDNVTLGFANCLYQQGVSLTKDIAVALLGLGTGFDPKEFAFGAFKSGTTGSAMVSGRSHSLRSESEVRNEGKPGNSEQSGVDPVNHTQSHKPAKQSIMHWIWSIIVSLISRDRTKEKSVNSKQSGADSMNQIQSGKPAKKSVPFKKIIWAIVVALILVVIVVLLIYFVQQTDQLFAGEGV